MRIRIPAGWDASIDALDRALSSPAKRWSAHPLTLIEALREIVNATPARDHGIRLGVSHRDWHSIRMDALASCNALVKVDDVLRLQALTEIDKEIKEFCNSLRKHPKNYTLANKWASRLLEKLDCDATCALIWDDLVTGSGSLNYDFFALLRDNFVAVASARHHDGDVGGTFRIAAGVLSDVAGHLSAAQEYVGDQRTVTYANPNELADWPLTDRLGLARKIWTTATRDADNIVWIGYRNNSLDVNEPLVVGQVTFYPVRLLREILANVSDDPRLPRELFADSIRARRHIENEDTETSVFARVDVGRGPVGPATSIARAAVEALLDLLGRDGSVWQESGVILKSVDGHMVGVSLFHPDGTLDDRPQADNDAVSTRIRNLNGELAPISFDGSLVDCIRAMRVIQDSKSRSDEKLVSLVRGIEIVRKDTDLGKDWGSLLSALIRDRWIVATALLELVDSMRMIADSMDWQNWIEDTANEAHVTGIIERIEHGRLTYGEACGISLELYNSFEIKWLPARRLQRALRLLSDTARYPKAATKEVGICFDHSLDRLRRRRNYVTHGGENQAETSRDVATFAKQVGNLLLPMYTEAKARGNSARVQLEAKRDRRASQVLELSQGGIQNVAAHWDGW